jgi:hypothetical protein
MVTSVSTTRAVQEQTQTIPIVITTGGDPVANGLIQNITQPEGNITGFISNEPSIAGKCLELLKEAALRVTRVAIIFNPELTPTAPSYLSSIETAALAFGIQAIKTTVRNAVDVVRAIDTFAAEPNGGLLILPPPPTTALRETILQLAAPTIALTDRFCAFAARRDMDDAAFRRDRMQVAVQRLGERLREVRRQEDQTRRRVAYGAAIDERDALAKELEGHPEK